MTTHAVAVRARHLRQTSVVFCVAAFLAACETVAPAGPPVVAEAPPPTLKPPVDAPLKDPDAIDPWIAAALADEAADRRAAADPAPADFADTPATAERFAAASAAGLDVSLDAENASVGGRYTIAGRTYHPREDTSYTETGEASWYGGKFHGRKTANGEKFDKWAMTGAHKTLPLNSVVRVTRLDDGRSVVIRINDRGPFKKGRIVELSRGAAERIGMVQDGLTQVQVEFLGYYEGGTDDRLTLRD